MEFFVVLVTLAVLAVFAGTFLSEGTSLLANTFNLFLPLSIKDQEFLRTHSSFYKELKPETKREFDERVKDLILEKEFIGKGMKITREVQLKVACSAIQLSIGLPHTIYLNFHRFVIYRHEFRTRNGQLYKGMVNPAFGTIMLSWKHFESGNEDPHDGLNLGLHEFAHALWLEDSIPNAEHGFLNPSFKANWERLSYAFVADQEACRRSIFRRYACTNAAEFFAAAVEHFFERPQEFAEHEAALYHSLAKLLNQNPLMK